MTFSYRHTCLFICVLFCATVNTQLINYNGQLTKAELDTKAQQILQYNKDKKQEIKSYSKYDEQDHGRKNEGQIRQPPPINDYVLMARYIVNQADWAPVATISTQQGVKSYPFVNVISISDGMKNNGSGIPYLFLTPLDFTAQDLFKDNRATLMMSLAQGEYCKSKDYDPMDPRCARVMLSGRIKPLKNDTAEHAFAKEAMFGRHPWLAHMPPDHHFFLAKLKMTYIALLDTFGGPKYINIQDYLHPKTKNPTSEFLRRYQSILFHDSIENRNNLEEENSNVAPSVVLV